MEQNLRPEKAAEALFALLDEKGKPVILDEEGQLPQEETSDLITLKSWAEKNGISPATARQKAGRGALKTARKVGRDWMISASEPNPDHRMRLEEQQRPAISGPVEIRKVLYYLRFLEYNGLPDIRHQANEHQEYCRDLYFGLRNRFTGNALSLFDLISRAMESQKNADVYYIPHAQAMAVFRDEAWMTQSGGSSESAGVTVDFEDYMHVLANCAGDMLRECMQLSVHYGQQVMFLPWYHSLSWKKTRDDGIYFVPSDFFRIIFEGIH